jgi:hypothetical protein
MKMHGVLSNSDWEGFQRMTSHIDDIKTCDQGSRWSDFVLMTMGILHYSSAKETFTLEQDVREIFARVSSISANIVFVLFTDQIFRYCPTHSRS